MKKRMGRPITLEPGNPRTVRAIMREHLRFAKMDIYNDLSRILGVSGLYAGTLMRRQKYAIVPSRIDRFIEAMQLDEFDANELRWQGAIEAGWKLNKEFLK